MTPKQLQQYDLFLDENDWDIYYWVTQEPTPTSMAYAEGAGPDFASPEAQGRAPNPTPVDLKEDRRAREPAQGEWAQTIGTFKPAYRPVPARWKSSEILSMLRRHVIDRSAGGVLGIGDSGQPDGIAKGDGKDHAPGVKGGSGLAFMPELRNFDQA